MFFIKIYIKESYMNYYHTSIQMCGQYCILAPKDSFFIDPILSLYTKISKNLPSSISLPFRYDNTTGTFTVPPGGAGYYYFHTNLVTDNGEHGIFDIQVNGEQTGTGLGDSDSTVYDTSTCSIALHVQEGEAYTI